MTTEEFNRHLYSRDISNIVIVELEDGTTFSKPTD